MSLDIKCTRCDCTIVHHCTPKDDDSESPRERVIRFYMWGPTDGRLGDEDMHAAFIAHGKRQGWITDEDMEHEATRAHPSGFFGSQAWSYAILGDRDEARSFHAHVDGLVRMLGFEPHEMKKIAADRIDAARREWTRVRDRRVALKAFKELPLETVACIHAGGLRAAWEAFPGHDRNDVEFFENIQDLARIHAERRARRSEP